eukprot:2962687-Rhodomonas_salina.2
MQRQMVWAFRSEVARVTAPRWILVQIVLEYTALPQMLRFGRKLAMLLRGSLSRTTRRGARLGARKGSAVAPYGRSVPDTA